MKSHLADHSAESDRRCLAGRGRSPGRHRPLLGTLNTSGRSWTVAGTCACGPCPVGSTCLPGSARCYGTVRQRHSSGSGADGTAHRAARFCRRRVRLQIAARRQTQPPKPRRHTPTSLTTHASPSPKHAAFAMQQIFETLWSTALLGLSMQHGHFPQTATVR